MQQEANASAGTAPYRQSIAGCLDTAIGRHGLSQAELGPWMDRLKPALSRLQDDYRTRRLPHLRIAEETSDIEAAEAAFAKLARGARAVIFFGTGGSSLGGQTLAQLGGWHVPGTADAAQKRRPRTRFYDNLDGATLSSALGSFDDLGGVRFIVISKSGGTPETLVQALAALDAVKAAGLEKKIPDLFLGVSEPKVAGKSNGLRTLFEAHGIPLLDHHQGIGGRFSALTNVGLLAAIARGLDSRGVRAGARSVVDALMAAGSPGDFAPAQGAAINIALAAERGVRAQVMMPYSDRLERFSALVRAAVGGKPRQERARHRAYRLSRAGRPAQPAAAVHGRPARAFDHGGARSDCRHRPENQRGAGRRERASTISPGAPRAISSPPRPRPCRRPWPRPAGRCAPSTSPALTSARWAR